MGHNTGGVVVCELCEGQKAGPIVLLVIAVYPEVLFKGLVSVLSLPITLWMIAGCEVQFHIEGHAQGLEEMRQTLSRDPMLHEMELRAWRRHGGRRVVP